MQEHSQICFLALALAASTPVLAQQSDECVGAVPVVVGVVYGPDFNAATPSALPWSCAGPGATTPDVWYSFTATTASLVRASTCNSFFWDTAIEVYRDGCAGLVSVTCDDNGCGGGIESAATFVVHAGDTYLLRVGATSVGGGGFVELVLSETLLPVGASSACLETALDGTNSGAVGGNVYFDLFVLEDVTITGLETRLGSTASGPVGLSVWTTADTYVGKTSSSANWTQAATDDGTASVTVGVTTPTVIVFAAPLHLTPGVYGIALQAFGARHHYTTIPSAPGGTPPVYATNGDVSLVFRSGAAQNVPFTGSITSSRLWNGRLCATPTAAPVGASYCGPAVPNSTGVSATIAGLGSVTLLDADLTLTSVGLPTRQFAIFLASTTQGFTASPGGSVGNLCLGGAIGRGVGGVIVNSGGSGAIAVQADLAAMPQPNAFVPVVSGETWYFQCWFRDADAFGPTSNYSDGLAVTFL